VAAAIRAGSSRPTLLPDLELEDVHDQGVELITGHPAAAIADGFAGVGRRLALVHSAIESLRSRAREVGSLAGVRVHVFVATAAPSRDVYFEEPDVVTTRLSASVGRIVREGLGHLIRLTGVDVMSAGGVACAEALRGASRVLASGVADAVLIVAVDSWLDGPSLEWLAMHHRLKCSDNPVGLIPGEAAVAVMVGGAGLFGPGAPPPAAWSRAVRIQGVEVCEATERPGAALAIAVDSAVKNARVSVLEGLTVVDLNGEERRASAWGNALVRWGPRFAGLVRLPAMSLGDTGAASGAVGLLLAHQGLVRGYARGSRAWVLSSSDLGLGACVALEVTP
jgi:3-oxoacyl-[acyl-carrier-protein] synthase-1